MITCMETIGTQKGVWATFVSVSMETVLLVIIINQVRTVLLFAVKFYIFSEYLSEPNLMKIYR